MRGKVVALICVVVGLLTQNAIAASPHKDRTLTVMTRNMDLGSDFGYIFQAVATNATLPQLVGAITKTYLEVLDSNMAARAQRLAREIDDVQPDLIGLQEVSRISTGPLGGAVTTQVADQLELLLAALAARDLHYVTVAVQKNLDGTLPSLPALGAGLSQLFALELADYDVVLARSDLPVSELKIEAVDHALFSAHTTFAIASTTLNSNHGWIAVDVKLRGKTYRFVTTHLDTAIPQVQAAQAMELVNGPLDTTLPLIVAGDLNSDANATTVTWPAYSILTSSGLIDAWRVLRGSDTGLTWPMFGEDPPFGPAIPLERIDVVLFKGSGIRADSIHETGTTPPFASDHAGVAAEFTLLP